MSWEHCFTVVVVSSIVVVACTRQDGGRDAARPPLPARTCPVAAPENGAAPSGISGVDVRCKSDADCTSGRNGRCSYSGGGHAAAVVQCSYDGCAGDADCAAGQLCICGGGGRSRNECVSANCHDSADCGGKSCDSSYGGVRGAAGRYCHGKRDKCDSASDCGAGETCNWVDTSGRWECMAELPHPVGRTRGATLAL